MNIANKITVSRLALALLFILAMSVQCPVSWIVSTFLFSLAAVTDYYDGKIARKYGIVTRFGELVDPVVDKVLVSSAFIFFLTVPVLKIPAWAVIVIISREFIITGIRLLAASQGQVLPAFSSGKQKTVFQVGGILVILLYLSLRELSELVSWNWVETLDRTFESVPRYLVLISALITVYSGLVYAVKNRRFLSSAAGENGSSR